MQFDLGAQGLGLLVAFSLVFGLVAQVVARGGTRGLWLIAAAGWFVGGLVASEVVWGRSTVAEIQPIIDGLAVDESLLGGLVVGVPVALVARYLTHGTGTGRPTAA